MKKGIEVNFTKVKKSSKRRKLGGSNSDTDSDEDSESDSDDDQTKEMKELLASKPTLRNADIFESKDPTAGQLFVFVGKSERGKTHFIRWLLMDQIQREVNPLKFGIVFVRTKFKHSYKFVPDEKIIQGYEEEILQQYVHNLEAMYEEQGFLEPSFLIFDDLVGILANSSPWFNNFIATYRHLNIHIFIAVQYLTGRHAVSPIMREQTTYAIMFNSKTHKTIENLYEAYGQLFEKKREFKDYLFANTEPSKVGPYVCLVYIEKEDRLEHNYIPMRAPKKVPKSIKLDF
jgi:hypothetical protein